MGEPRVTGGTLTLSNGATTQFSLDYENGWSQWGAIESDLWVTLPLVEALLEKAIEDGLLEEDENDN